MIIHHLILAVIICVQSTSLIGSAHELHALYATADMEQGRQHPFLRLPYDLRAIVYSYLSGIVELSEEERTTLLKNANPCILYCLTKHALANINLTEALNNPDCPWAQSQTNAFLLPYFLQAGGHYWATGKEGPWKGDNFLATAAGDMLHYRQGHPAIRYQNALPKDRHTAFARYDEARVPTVIRYVRRRNYDSLFPDDDYYITEHYAPSPIHQIAQASLCSDGYLISLLEYQDDSTTIINRGSIHIPHDHLVETMHFLAPFVIATYGSDQTLRVWDLKQMQCTRTLQCRSPITAFLRTSDHPQPCVALGHQDGSITTWQWESNTILSKITRARPTIDQDRRPIHALALVAYRYLVSSHADGTVRVWDNFTDASRSPTCLIEQAVDCPVMLQHPYKSSHLIFVDKQDKAKVKKIEIFTDEHLESRLKKTLPTLIFQKNSAQETRMEMPMVPGCPVQ